MASNPNTRVAGGRGARLRVNPAQQAQSRGNQRFSWAETPIEMQDPRHASFHQRSRSDDAPIALPTAGGQQERDGSQTMWSTQAEAGDDVGTQTMWPSRPQLQQQELERGISAQQQPQGQAQGAPVLDQRASVASVPRSSSPYGVPEPTHPHPALFAPIVSNGSHDPPSRPGSIPHALPQSPAQQQPIPEQPPSDFNPRNSTQKPLPAEPEPIKKAPTQIYSPTSLQNPQLGFNPSAAAHKPGQISHPNMDMSAPGSKAQWYHHLCECSTDMGTCLEGFFCPCTVYGRTSYRLNAKSDHKDATDLLGFERVNSRCLLFTATMFCGLHCKLIPGLERMR